MYTTVSTVDDHKRLQDELDKLTEWQNQWQMKFNPSKCYVMHMSLSHNPPRFEYRLCNQRLEVVKSHPYLGVHLQDNLDWRAQVGHATAKANRMLGVLRRNLYACPEELKVTAYRGLVRPHLEYAAAAWDPYKVGHVTNLEKVQRSAARFVKRNYCRAPGTVTELIEQLGWDSLAERRRRSRLILMYKIMNGLVDIPYERYLKPLSRYSRHCNSQSFFPIQARINAYKYSFFPRTAIDWNNLNELIVDANSLDKFRGLI